MRSTSSARALACLWLLIQGFASASPSSALAFRLTPRGGIIVPVTLNGTAQASFLFDTGSNASVISAGLASTLGIRAVAKTTVLSASGQKPALVTRIEHLAMGAVDTRDVLATIAEARDLDLPDAAEIGCRIDGVIGQDVLRQLRYTIDYRAGRIDWRKSPDDVPQRGSRFELEWQDDRYLVRLPQKARELRLVPDTGTEALVLFERSQHAADRVFGRDHLGLTGLGGTRSAHPTIVRELRVGESVLTNVRAVIVARDTEVGSIDGLLPLHLFARVTFDAPDGQLFIER